MSDSKCPPSGKIDCPCGKGATRAHLSCDAHDPVAALREIRALLDDRQRFVMLGMRSFSAVADIVNATLEAHDE